MDQLKGLRAALLLSIQRERAATASRRGRALNSLVSQDSLSAYVDPDAQVVGLRDVLWTDPKADHQGVN